METLIYNLTLLLSLTTGTGVLLHDTKLDKLPFTSMVSAAGKHAGFSAATLSDNGITPDLHAHSHRSVHTISGFSYQSPAIPPREGKAKKHMLQNYEPRRRHAFDNIVLPIVS